MGRWQPRSSDDYRRGSAAYQRDSLLGLAVAVLLCAIFLVLPLPSDKGVSLAPLSLSG